MQLLLDYFLSLPNSVAYGIFGAIGGATGALVGSVLSKFIKTKETGKITILQISVIIFTILSIQLPKYAFPDLPALQAMHEIKERRFFSVLFKHHPEAEVEFKEKIGDIIKNSPSQEIYLKMQALSAEITSRYFYKYIMLAEDKVVHDMLKRNLDMMKKLETYPQLCVSYYLGQVQFSEENIIRIHGSRELAEEFVQEELNFKADVIESAISNPSALSKPANVDELSEILTSIYQANGYALANLDKVYLVANMPAEEGCQVALEFSNALAALEVEQSSNVFKSLVGLSGL